MSGAGCRAGARSVFICEICAMTKGDEVIEVMKIIEVMKLWSYWSLYLRM